MIYTVTFNPSLDYIMTVDELKLGMTNRTSAEQIFPGGKGINVSMVLNNLGFESTNLGFIAGFVGKEIKRLLEEKGCNSHFVEIENEISRINIKIKNIDGTEINGIGPNISDDKVNELLEQLSLLKNKDVLILAGSIPASMSSDIYKKIMEILSDKDIIIAVDATKDLLLNVLENKPFLIKPNNHELGEVFGVEIKTKAQALKYAKELQKKGARNVLVSMAGEGAVLAAENGSDYESPAPKGKLVNAVGAGDSMVAGFMAGWLSKQNYEHAFKMGISTGSASAFSENLATKKEVETIYNAITDKQR